MKLVLCESPVKKEKIQEYLGKDYLVIATKGHMTELSKQGYFNLGINIDKNFEQRHIISDGKIDLFKNIVNKAKESDEIYMAQDPDSEGNLIAYLIADKLKDCLYDKKFKRLKFNQISKKKIIESLDNIKDLDEQEAMFGKTRMAIDRIVGFLASPFVSNVFGSALSAGRVQSVAVKLIVEAEEDIENFVPETFYTISGTLQTSSGEEFNVNYPLKFKDKAKADLVLDELQKSTFNVFNIEDNIENKNPPPPMITSTLQQTMSKLYGFNAEKTMELAQKCYEAGYITYLRTDSTRIEPEAVQDARDLLTKNGHKIPNKPNVFKNKSAVQDAHECIRPVTIEFDASKLSFQDKDEEKLYDTVWKYFIASQASPAKYSTRKVVIKSNEFGHELKCSGKCLIEANYLDILGIKDGSKIEIPNLVQNESLQLVKDTFDITKKKTQPPPRFTLSELIKTLEARGIGRPSTYAQVLSTIEARGFCELKGNVYHPTELGRKVIKLLDKKFSFMDYDFTKKMEEDLEKVEVGELSYVDMLSKFYPLFKKEIVNAYNEAGIKLCSKCESPLRKSKDKDSYFCSNYKFCK
ncbi:MAG: type I DNA topoisomerase [Chitinophagales bacterium]|nr:type I DNA topoisomerase [Chitinophagales bacterium]